MNSLYGKGGSLKKEIQKQPDLQKTWPVNTVLPFACCLLTLVCILNSSISLEVSLFSLDSVLPDQGGPVEVSQHSSILVVSAAVLQGGE